MAAKRDLLERAAAALQEAWSEVIDPRKLRPAELVRLLNSGPLGPVLDARRVARHRGLAGFRIGDERTIDLFRYAGWLAEVRHAAPRAAGTAATDGSAGYEAQREAARERGAAQSRAGRDIGEIPAPRRPRVRSRAERDLAFFCRAYLGATFYLPFSPDQRRAIEAIQHTVLNGGLLAFAMPRGTGKTALCEAACLWALLSGHRRFVALIGPDEAHAMDRVKNLRVELERNHRLLADWPECCHPIHALEGITQRRLLFRGEPVRMEFTAKRLMLPSIPGSRSAGAVVATAGLTGQLRGMSHKRHDGITLRPELVLLDDPQTDESARSLSQCAERERIITGGVLGLAGPGQKLAALMPCTVIRAGDLADVYLDRGRHPEWNGWRTKLVYQWPTGAAEKLWAEYADIRADSLRRDDHGRAATEFYRAHRAAMDEGALVAWPERHEPDELSALQHAVNLRLRDPIAFAAEYQNEPIREDSYAHDLLTADQVAEKLSRHARGVAPIAATRLSAFIDVQQRVLFWCVCAWDERFGGAVIDYGTYPEQPAGMHFTARDAPRDLAHAHPGTGFEGALFAGLGALTAKILGREWQRDGGAVLRVGLCLIDAGWGQSTATVYQFCRQSEFGPITYPSYGRYVGAASRPFSDYRPKPGERVGLNWRMPHGGGRRAQRYVLFDSNFWKTFIAARLLSAAGDVGSLSLFGDRPATHRLFAEHVTAEYRVQAQVGERRVEEWKIRPHQTENHWLDCLVGCAVGASVLGCELVPSTAGRHALHGPRTRVLQPAPPGRGSFFITAR